MGLLGDDDLAALPPLTLLVLNLHQLLHNQARGAPRVKGAAGAAPAQGVCDVVAHGQGCTVAIEVAGHDAGQERGHQAARAAVIFSSGGGHVTSGAAKAKGDTV